ncbi:hypothetical protein Tco_0613141 [Tanacetum coccineum]
MWGGTPWPTAKRQCNNAGNGVGLAPNVVTIPEPLRYLKPWLKPFLKTLPDGTSLTQHLVFSSAESSPSRQMLQENAK